MVSFFDNSTGGWTTGPQSTGSTWEIGARVSFDADVPIEALRFYRHGTGAGYAPTRLRLWDLSTHTLLTEVTSPTDSGAVGWQESAITPVTIDSTHIFGITGWVPNGNTSGYKLSGALGTAPTPLHWPANCRCWAPAGTTGEPTNNDNVLAWSFDVRVGAASIPPDPADPVTAGNLANSLAAWLLATSENTHQADGLPWLTKALLQSTYDLVSGINTRLAPSGGPLTVLTDLYLNDLKTQIDAQTALDALVSSRLTGASGGGGSAFYGPSGTQVAEGVETLLASGVTPTSLGAALALLREQLTLSPDLADTSRWTLVDTTSGDGDALVSQQADAYFFSITTYPASQAAHAVAATLWLPRWGWVCPRVHGHFAQRQFHDIMPTIITADGHLMDGLLIYTPSGFEWTCESYVLDR